MMYRECYCYYCRSLLVCSFVKKIHRHVCNVAVVANMAFENMGPQRKKQIIINVFVPISVQHTISGHIWSSAGTHGHVALFGTVMPPLWSTEVSAAAACRVLTVGGSGVEELAAVAAQCIGLHCESASSSLSC